MLSDTAPPVSCSTAHSTETYQLGTLSAQAGQRYPAYEERTKVTKDACVPELVRSYLGARPRQALYGVWTVAFLPTAQQWQSGQRWVRCDLVLVRDETADFDPIGVELPLRAAATTDASDLLMRCYAKDEDNDSGFSDVRCSEPHESRDVNMWIPVTEPPDETVVAQMCAPAVTEWSALAGRPADGVSGVLHTEDNGSLTLRCVAVEKHVSD